MSVSNQQLVSSIDIRDLTLSLGVPYVFDNSKKASKDDFRF